VLVTWNAKHFRGPREAPGTAGQFAGVSLHAGLICLNGPVGMDLGLQRELFSVVLAELDRDSDFTNQVMEVNLSGSRKEIDVIRYRMPRE